MNVDYRKLTRMLGKEFEFEDNAKEYIKSSRCPILLLTKKDETLEYFKQFESKELFEYLSSLKIKKDVIPTPEELGDVSAIFFTSGQLITLLENAYTFFQLLEMNNLHVGSVKYWITNLMAIYPTAHQMKALEVLFKDLNLSFDGTEKFAPYIFRKLLQNWNKSIICPEWANASIFPFMNTKTAIPKLVDLISEELPDFPQTILIITPNPQQFERIANEKFLNTFYPHKFIYAKITHPKFEEIKMEYFDESIGVTNEFLLRDLAEEIS